jgi:calcium-independent phospholipase A2-gamma
MVNNPSSVAISEAKTLWHGSDLQCVVSLGTGITLGSRADLNMNDIYTEPEADAKGIKSLTWKGKFLKVLDSATDTESVHYTLKELLPKEVYFRFNPYLSDVVGLDESKPDKLDKIQEETREYLVRNVDRVTYLSKVLMKQKTLSGKVTDWWYY